MSSSNTITISDTERTRRQKSLSLRELIRLDLQRQNPKKSSLLSILSYARRPGFLAVLLYRFSSASIDKGALGNIAALFFARLNLWFNACDIDPRAVIGPGFLIAHPVGIVIGRAAIGRNFRIQQNVTIGVRDVMNDAFNFMENGHYNPASYPLLADNVTVCAGAAVLGSIKIGIGAMIGANAVVLHDVPDGYLAVGVPARAIERRQKVAAP